MAPRIEPTTRQTEVTRPPVTPARTTPRESTVAIPRLPEADRKLFLGQNNLGADTMRLRLNARFDQNGPGGTSINATPVFTREKVDAAVRTIREKLDEGFLGDVSHGDLSAIQREIQKLTRTEATEVFSQLSDSDLKKWADELDGTIGSFSTSEKKALFDDLAGKLDSQQAQRFMTALGDQDNIKAFADSISHHAPAATKEALIGRLAGQVETNPAAALAVAEIMGGMRGNPRELEGALRGLTQPQLSAVMRAASQEELHVSQGFMGSGGSVSTTYDSAPLVDMINAVSGIGNADLKARVFQAGSLEMKRLEEAGSLLAPAIGNENAARDVRNSLTTLLNSDTTGIMTSLEHNFRNGDGVSAWAKSMLADGQTEALGQVIARLSKGNDLTGNPLTRFGQQVSGTDGQPHYRNAQVLGYFAGGLLAGARQITGDRTKQADMLKNVFGTIAGATGALNPAAGIASSVINGLTQSIVGEVTDGLNKGTMSMEEALQQLIFPRNSSGNLYEGAAEATYDSALSRVLDRNP